MSTWLAAPMGRSMSAAPPMSSDVLLPTTLGREDATHGPIDQSPWLLLGLSVVKLRHCEQSAFLSAYLLSGSLQWQSNYTS
jgi:hypothetical protein